MRFIDEIINKIKEYAGISGIHRLWLIKQIEIQPTPEEMRLFRDKHQFKSDPKNDQLCLCGREWNIAAHE